MLQTKYENNKKIFFKNLKVQYATYKRNESTAYKLQKKLTNYFKQMYFPPHLFVPLFKILCCIRDQFKTVSYLKRSEHF